MAKKQPPKNRTWVQLTKDFVREWPEVLEGLQFQNMPVKYLKYVNVILKNNVTINYNIEKELKIKSQNTIARLLKHTLEKHYKKIKNVDIKFNIPALKKDMQSKTSSLMSKTFKLHGPGASNLVSALPSASRKRSSAHPDTSRV